MVSVVDEAIIEQTPTKLPQVFSQTGADPVAITK